jgi:hypothetical protein
MSEEIELIESPLSGPFQGDGIIVDVHIYKIQGGEWTLEVVDADGDSTVWEDSFETDEEALAQFIEDFETEGLEAIISPEVDGE